MRSFDQPHCWRITLTTSAKQAAALIEALAITDAQTFKNLPGLKVVHECWKRHTLTDQEFLHKAKTMVAEMAKVAAANTLVKAALNGIKAADVFKNAGLNRPDSNYDKAELALGHKAEAEHTKNAEAADIIAKDHLDEDPNYYSKLKKLEL